MRLYTPGPVEIPDRVLRALAARPPHHRSDVFQDVLKRLHPKLDALFATEGRVVLLAGSGTAGMDAAVANLAAPGARAVVAKAGKFGERWEKICHAHGIEPVLVEAEWGSAIDPERWRGAMEKHLPEIALLTHSETSTATLHDLKALSAIAKDAGALVVADVVTSFGVHEFRQDEFQVDVAVSGSQKGVMLPPGLALVGLGPRALERLETHGPAGHVFYLDLARAAKSAESFDTPFTPAVSLIQGLVESVAMIEEIGLEGVWQRHASIAQAIRRGGVAAGYRLLSSSPANSVTGFFPPDGVDAKAVIEYCKERYEFVLAGGQDHLKGKIVRVGHMGLAYDSEDAYAVCDALEDAARALGATGIAGAAREAVTRSLQELPCESSSPTP